MILDGQILGKPIVLYGDTKANIAALSNLSEKMIAYATDTDGVGIYNGSAWIWYTNTSLYATTSSNLTLTANHYWVKVAASCTISLPTAVGIQGREYIISATSNGVVVNANGSETINGSVSQSLLNKSTMQIKSDNGGWIII